MITINKIGRYELCETRKSTKILYLNQEPYIWINIRNIGQILIKTNNTYKTDKLLSVGNFMLYDVKDDPYLTDLQHLELEYGLRKWQGYLLPTGLPTDSKKRSRIIPTTQVITGVPHFGTAFQLQDKKKDKVLESTTNLKRASR